MPNWITTSEAAELTGYSSNHVIRLIELGKVKGQRWGRDWQVDKTSLLAYAKKAAKLGEKRGPKTDR